MGMLLDPYVAYRAPFVSITFLFLWAVNVQVFLSKRIDYVSALNLAKDEIMRPSDIAQSAAVLYGVLGSFYVLEWLTVSWHPIVADVCPLLLYVALITILCWPGDSMFRRPRAMFARVCKNMMMPPPGVTPYLEVHVADGFTSLTRVMADVAVCVCMVVAHVRNGSPDGCRVSYIVPIVLSLPTIWRARQCYAGYVASGQLFPHMVNWGKYMSALPVIWCSELSRHGDASRYLADAYFVCAIINTAYSYAWDIKMDWGLLEPNNGGPLFLRTRLLFRSRWVYYFIAVTNLCLRLLWTVRYIPGSAIPFGPETLALLLELAEVSRRFLWNFLRVEWECVRIEHTMHIGPHALR
eukprot:Opistho-1_new@30895